MSADPTYLTWALLLGGLSAVSLPVGSAVGLALRPRAAVAATLAAFGAGALIAALTVELVAPTVDAVGAAEGHELDEARAAFRALVLGAILGGLLFVSLDRILAERGGFLRKTSTAITWFTRRRQARVQAMLKDLCALPALRLLPADRVGLLVEDVRQRIFSPGEVLFREGDFADEMYFVKSGEVALTRGGDPISSVGAGGIIGELALLADVPRTVAATAREIVETYVLRRNDFQRWRRECPEFDRAVREVASERFEEIRQRDAEMSEEERRWGEAAIAALREGVEVPDAGNLRRMAEEHSGAPLAVWLGMLVDGVPESIVIGSGLMALVSAELAASGAVAFREVIPYTLIAGLFISNFPEALSSSLGMQHQGWSPSRIIFMWVVLMLVTAFGAAAGYALGEALGHTTLVAVEGVAVGAMLTMIASTMIPEAVHLGGSSARVGLATLLGFLAAISFKLIE
jgi:CRP-like cAMP-binding protein